MVNAASRLPFNALRVLVAVGRHGSLTKAAEALHVEPSAISMQMKALADYVGVPLLEKVGRSVALTPTAQALIPAIASGLTQIEGAIQGLERRQRDRFVLSVLPSALSLWLLPQLPQLQRVARLHGRKLVFAAATASVDLASEGCDAAIRLGHGSWPGLDAQRVADETLVPVCAPGLARAVGRVEAGTFPRGIDLLSTKSDSWLRWATHHPRPEVLHTVVIEDPVALVLAAEAGLGVALARGRLAEAALAAGRLVQVGPAIAYRYAYFWVTLPGASSDPLGLAMADALRASVGAADGAPRMPRRRPGRQ
jgi:DNA-binding transcriptional LysR family regulator